MTMLPAGTKVRVSGLSCPAQTAKDSVTGTVVSNDLILPWVGRALGGEQQLVLTDDGACYISIGAVGTSFEQPQPGCGFSLAAASADLEEL